MKTLTALVVAAIAIAGCGSSSSSSNSSTTKAASSSGSGGAYGGAANTTASNTSSGSGSTNVTMNDDYFGPKVISGKPGSTVTVKLKNVGSNEHNFKIDGQAKADADVKPGATGTATVKIPTSGTVQFYCEYHKGLGMVGTVKAS